MCLECAPGSSANARSDATSCDENNNLSRSPLNPLPNPLLRHLPLPILARTRGLPRGPPGHRPSELRHVAELRAEGQVQPALHRAPGEVAQLEPAKAGKVKGFQPIDFTFQPISLSLSLHRPLRRLAFARL